MAKASSKNGNIGTRTKSSPSTGVSPEERRHMIAEAAYYRALRRGFRGGDAVSDWLTAEREINERLLHASGQGHGSALSGQASRTSVASESTIASSH